MAQKLNKKVEFINTIYKNVLSGTEQDLLEIVQLENKNLIGNLTYKAFADAYKELYYKIRFVDKEVKPFHCFSEECDILRFKLLIIYNAIREVLEKEFGITQICVNKETDNWMFIS